ncbi:glycine--tRNA ligase subunit beta [Parasaccharibacter sp. TMW 2.1884]|uniref:glycine--tRNA ligase subunit beta n=1 Tax=Parasaccharibacter sp. TMW 2.1884 TaxID=2267834 RepID=UPI00131872A3|nr:glycine--tRNA ligase subunit beta [Parasaccharibacter sp. TMW 2.1884]MCL1510993.1 glycine--tRNA ligase subunit beta [Parasaccharibacter sp. TMW 2.1884]QGT74805.1 glycine--tRNA ligase subunit beta [Bombella sp. ESL0368]
MAELLLDLFCEEIPSGMQARAAEDLARLLEQALADLNPRNIRSFHGARHIAASLEVDESIPTRTISERGPRENAPEKALAGFSRKHGVSPDELTKENGFWVLNRTLPPVRAAELVAEQLPDLLWKFPWPKAMRWGNGSLFTWVRPLHHIVCLLDGQTVPFTLARQDDDAHGLKSGNVTEGHRILSPGTFTVTGTEQWLKELEARHVVINEEKRADLIRQGVHALADEKGLALVEDEGLVREVSGLVEYPVPLLGRIDDAFMDLPPEVMQVSMRVNQRYFALRTKDGKAAPYFAFVANQTFSDGGTLCIAGNERVLRARFADARHFWDLDRKTKLAGRVEALKPVTFHAKLGTQEERARRISTLAGIIATAMQLSDAQVKHAERAGLLAKADLTTGMVGEFPELQGVMGGYYAAHDGEAPEVAQAVAEHYMPRGLQDGTASAPVSVAVALADRLDMLAGFFAIGETPTGSGDPYGLRRAALGVIRTIRDNGLRIDLGSLLSRAAEAYAGKEGKDSALGELEPFFTDRLRVQLRNEGRRHDVLDATLAVTQVQENRSLFTDHLDGDLVRLLSRVEALSDMMGTEDGQNLLAAYRRATNILRIEEKKDGPHHQAPEAALYVQDEERDLDAALNEAGPKITASLADDDFTSAMQHLAALRPIMDRFFEAVTVNAEDAGQRLNRLRLLSAFSRSGQLIADFGRIEG